MSLDLNPPALAIQNAKLQFGERTLWDNLALTVAPGSFVAVLGANGAGKTSLLKVLLGLQSLDAGSVAVYGEPARRGNTKIGYIPQQKAFDRDLPIRGRDLVRSGIDGHMFGISLRHKETWSKVDEAIRLVGATAYADQPIGLLSGGEQQRLRIAQALVAQPELLLCDEPLTSLDLEGQKAMSSLIDSYRRRHHATVLFVTHDINPIQHMVDEVLYLAAGQWVMGHPETVLTSDSLSRLYGTPVDVLRVRNQVVIVNTSVTENAQGHHIPANHVPYRKEVKS
jgi:zinc/manganese transport system ATP-binding protein